MDNESLVLEYQNGNKNVLNAIVKNNINLVRHIALKLKGIIENKPFDVDDLVQEGLIAVINAAANYNVDSGFKFSTHAGKNAKFAMLNFINRTCISRYNKGDMNSEVVNVLSINMSIGEKGTSTLEEVIEYEKAREPFLKVEENIDRFILRNDLLNVLDRVFSKDGKDGKDNYCAYKTLILYYGFESKALSFEEIAAEIGLSGSRIQQIHNKAIRSIRQSKAGKALMEKYKYMMIGLLKDDRSELNSFANSSSICCKLDTIDEMIKNILNKNFETI